MTTEHTIADESRITWFSPPVSHPFVRVARVPTSTPTKAPDWTPKNGEVHGFVVHDADPRGGVVDRRIFWRRDGDDDGRYADPTSVAFPAEATHAPSLGHGKPGIPLPQILAALAGGDGE